MASDGPVLGGQWPWQMLNVKERKLTVVYRILLICQYFH